MFTGVSSGLQVYSQLQAGKTAMRVAKYNDKNAQAEAANVEAEAKNVEAAARNKELEFAEGVKRERMNERRQMATLRARLSSQGTRTDTGTSIDILGETAGNFQLAISDAARATNMQRASMIQNAASLRLNADSLRRQGKIGIWEAKQAKKASTLSAIGTGISAATQMATTYAHNRYSGAIK